MATENFNETVRGAGMLLIGVKDTAPHLPVVSIPQDSGTTVTAVFTDYALKVAKYGGAGPRGIVCHSKKQPAAD